MENSSNNLVPCNAAEIIKKCRSKEDIQNICREIGILFINLFIGYYWPREPGFDGKYFLQFGAGIKKVSIFLYKYRVI